MKCDRHINLDTAADAALGPFTAGTFRINSLYGSMTSPTGYTSTCGSLKRTQFLLERMQARFGLPLFYDKAKKYQSCTKMAADGAEQDYDGQGHNPFRR